LLAASLAARFEICGTYVSTARLKMSVSENIAVRFRAQRTYKSGAPQLHVRRSTNGHNH